MDWLLWLIAAIATYRATRIVTGDRVSLWFRSWVADKLGEQHWIPYGLECDFCVSFWLGMPAAAAVVWHSDQEATWLVLGFLAFSAVTGILAQREPEQ